MLGEAHSEIDAVPISTEDIRKIAMMSACMRGSLRFAVNTAKGTFPTLISLRNTLHV